jgi:hypothetical protein
LWTDRGQWIDEPASLNFDPLPSDFNGFVSGSLYSRGGRIDVGASFGAKRWIPGSEVDTNSLATHNSFTIVVHEGPENMLRAAAQDYMAMQKNSPYQFSIKRASAPARSLGLDGVFDPFRIVGPSRAQHHRPWGVLATGFGVLGVGTAGWNIVSNPEKRAGLFGPDYDQPLRDFDEMLAYANVSVWVTLAYPGDFISPKNLKIRVCPPPRSISKDESKSRLHNPTGPALAWKDGTSVYAIDGVFMNGAAHAMYMHPRYITIDSLFDRNITRDNEEVRRILTERAGGFDEVIERSMEEDDGLNAKIVAEDEYGKLYAFLKSRTSLGNERFRVLAVENYTPEEDGSRRKYFIPVPPEMSTPKEAVAWTYGFTNAANFTIHQSG